MRPRSIVFLTTSLGVFAALPAQAQDCPEGDWFCEPATEQPAAVPQPPPPPLEAPAPPPPRATRFHGEFVAEPEPPPPRVRRRRVRHRWGFDLHLLGALMAGDNVADDAGMGGLGFGLRYRPIPYFALDGTIELAFGTDYNGFDRTESALLVNAVGFINPRNPVQFYMLAGLGLASADISRDRRANGPYADDDDRYEYFGMQFGAGVEARLTRRAALRVDVLGFIRGRTDDGARANPEFVDPDDHRTTNTSGGAFLRAGGLFYF